MSHAKPFSWTVRFTVDPTWIADGFTLSNDRAHSMLAMELGGARNDEFSATVLEAPMPLQLAFTQGYTMRTTSRNKLIAEILADAPDTGVISSALQAAYNLIDSVAFIAKEGDTNAIKGLLTTALELINARRGDPVEYDA